MLSCLGWGYALRASGFVKTKLRPDMSDFALRATTGHVDPTRRVQRAGLKNPRQLVSKAVKIDIKS